MSVTRNEGESDFDIGYKGQRGHCRCDLCDGGGGSRVRWTSCLLSGDFSPVYSPDSGIFRHGMVQQLRTVWPL